MSADNGSISVWSPVSSIQAATQGSDLPAIVQLAESNLSKRDIQAIISAFNADSFEMVSTFVWSKAAATLKKQLATLGMEFIGEMLERPDLNEDSDPASTLADHEVVGLAEDLGMISSTQCLRLKQALELVNHYAKLDQQDSTEDPMMREEALGLIKTCVSAILGQPQFSAAQAFVGFRQRLGTATLTNDDPSIDAIRSSPYFFVRTTLGVLLSTIKTSKGATQEHSIGNAMLLIPVLWPRLRDPAKWQVGQAYAEVNAAGNWPAASGLKKALLDVQGFDFVPETLRSNTFTEAAARVLAAHFAFNNFYNEAAPMRILASLGSSIPMPAFPKCMQAALAVWLGNTYGIAHAAIPEAEKLMGTLRPAQWTYYFNQCLPNDRHILDKLTSEKPGRRWCALLQKIPEFHTFVLSNAKVASLIKVSTLNTLPELQASAQTLRFSVSNSKP